MTEARNPLEAILAELEARDSDPAKRDPQRFDPRCRWSKATAKAAIKALTLYESMIEMGELEADEATILELRRALRIAFLIVGGSETESIIEDYD
jgi:hypothetical protein